MNIPIASQNINFPGYGMFWVANSISSTLLGKRNRDVQKRAHDQNLEFQREMERARFITDDERIQKEIAFKRRLVALSREYRLKESRASFNNQMKAVELKHFLQYCWPLDPQLPYILLKEIENADATNSNRLNVILLHGPLLPLRAYGSDANELDAQIYSELEYSIKKNDIPLIGDVFFRKDACLRPDLTGGNASIMNIHFLMSQIPTLVISPRYSEGRMYFTGAVWEPQASRPLIRPLIDFEYNRVKTLNDDNYRLQVIDLLHAAVSITIGSVRDSYMLLTQGKAPTLSTLLNDKGHKKMKELVASETSLKSFLAQEIKNNIAALDDKKMPQLLEIYNKEDIQSMRRLLKSN